MGIPPAINSQFSLDRVSGIPVHLFCWCHVERFIGPSAEKNLGSLVYALRSRSPYSHWEQEILNFRPSFDPGTFILSVVLIEELGLTWSGGEDPFDSKAVRRLIKRSAWVNTNHKRRKAKYREAFLPFCSLLRLQLDIQYLVFDLLDYEDVPKVRKGVRWPISDRYWQCRAPKDFIHELRDIPDDNLSVDWEYLVLQLERLISQPQWELANRKMIFVRLQEPRSILCKLLKGVTIVV